MDTTGESTVKKAEEQIVPDDLMQELHEANGQFHRLKEEIDSAMADTKEQHQGRLDAAIEDLRKAERRVEEINARIHGTLKPPPGQ